MIFRSRYDLWLKIVLNITNLMMVGSIVIFFADGNLGLIFLGLVTLAILVCFVWMQLATWYRIDEDALFIRSGPLHWTIPIASIVAMAPSDDPTSGPALSFDRLRIDYMKNGEKKEILISPEDREGFERELRLRGALGG